MLENSHLKLRPLEPEDLGILYKWENDTSLWIHGQTVSPYSKLALRQYISNSIEQDIYQNKQLRLMIDLKKENKTIGTIDLYDFDVRNLRAGIGILIDEQFREKDYACESIEIIKAYAFSFLHLHQLYAHILSINTSSIGLFKKAGFVQNGILKEWVLGDNEYMDISVFQVINQ